MSITKSTKRTLLIVFSILIISSLILTACGAIEELAAAAGGEKGKPENPGKGKGDDDDDDTKGQGKGDDDDTKGGPAKEPFSTKEHGVGHVPITICHATGSQKNPYVIITIDKMGELMGHQKHPRDIIPMPDEGCPINGDDDVDDDDDDDDANDDIPDIEPQASVCIQYIVFHTFRDGDLEVYSLFNGAEDSPNAQLYNLSSSSSSEDSRPSRSPNDQYVVFESNRDGNVELYLTDPYGTFQTQLTDTNANNINPMFLADNQTIVFQSDRTGNWDIFKLDIFTLEEVQLTTDSNDDIFPFASPDPNWVVFQSNRFGNEDLFLLNVYTGEEFQLTDGAGDEIFPAWSASGEQIAYLSDEDGDWALYVMDFNGENKELIAGGPDVNIGNHSWSPEGFRIAYQSEEGGNTDIFTYDFRTGEYYRLTDFAGVDSSPTWDCGGSMISFTTDRDGDPNVYQTDWQGLEDESYLTNHPATDKWSEWSPSKEAGSRGW